MEGAFHRYQLVEARIGLIDPGGIAQPQVTYEAGQRGPGDGGRVLVPTKFKPPPRRGGGAAGGKTSCWVLHRKQLVLGLPGKVKFEVANGEGGGGGSDDDAAVIARCAASTKSLTLLPGPPMGLVLRSFGVSGCRDWTDNARADGRLMAGYSLEDLDLQVAPTENPVHFSVV